MNVDRLPAFSHRLTALPEALDGLLGLVFDLFLRGKVLRRDPATKPT